MSKKKIQRYTLTRKEYLEFDDEGWWCRHRDHELVMEKATEEARAKALREAVDACEKVEQDFGDEHALLCDCMTLVEDECSCHLSTFRKAVEALEESETTP